MSSISSSTYICLMFWLTQFGQEHAYTHNSPASRQEHFPTSTYSLYIQYRWVRSRTSTGADGWMCIIRPSSHADQLRRTGSISSWSGMWIVHQINVWHLARRTWCLKAYSVEGSIGAVCYHGHGVAHSLSVSTSLLLLERTRRGFQVTM